MKDPYRKPFLKQARDLTSLLIRRNREALESGELSPLKIEPEWVHHPDGDFVIWRLLEPNPKPNNLHAGQNGPPVFNPFSPIDPKVLAARLTKTHVLLFNRFPVEPGQLLIVPENFASQSESPVVEDFQAILTALKQINGLVIYNCGVAAGASQPHRHFHLAPFPFYNRNSYFTEARFAGDFHSMPYLHERIPMDSDWFAVPLKGARVMDRVFRNLSKRLPPRADYHILVTRQYMTLILRKARSFRNIHLNGFAIAGFIPVTNREDHVFVKQNGLLPLFDSVLIPADR